MRDVGQGQVHVVVRKHASPIDHLAPHTRSPHENGTREEHHVFLAAVFSRYNPSNNVLVSLSGLEHLVKHFSLFVPCVSVWNIQYACFSGMPPLGDTGEPCHVLCVQSLKSDGFRLFLLPS
jgi:hypothetical protein